MAKNLKLNIKNAQIAEALNLGGLKEKLKKKAAAKTASLEAAEENLAPQHEENAPPLEEASTEQPPAPRIKARTKSAFAEPHGIEEAKHEPPLQDELQIETVQIKAIEETTTPDYSEAVFLKPVMKKEKAEEKAREEAKASLISAEIEKKLQEKEKAKKSALEKQEETQTVPERHPKPQEKQLPPPKRESRGRVLIQAAEEQKRLQIAENLKRFHTSEPREKLGPTGKHIKDLIPPAREKKQVQPKEVSGFKDVAKGRERERSPGKHEVLLQEEARVTLKTQDKKGKPKILEESTEDKGADAKKLGKISKFREFKDIKPAKKQDTPKTFDARDRLGLRDQESEESWRRRRPSMKRKLKPDQQDVTIRPTSLKVRLPITIKDLAAEMKLKASELIGKLFMQGVILTLNDFLDDETMIQLLGAELGCDIQIDTSEKERLQITDKTIKEEIEQADESNLSPRPPVVAFMGHVDHGKTSLIDAIRNSNRVLQEAGAITQHIGAFSCSTPVGKITILDTPGHEAFSAMRARGADVTDIVVLVVAGDEGIKPQTIEAIEHAKTAGVTLVVAINKCDKPNFNAENVYRQLSEQELLPEAWGGQVITVNCSAVTGEGIPHLLEMLALQSEVLELKANPESRARGTVIESQMHKGMGAVATVLVQNGTLNVGDSLVFEQTWGRIKTMRDEHGKMLLKAGPSTPVQITGLSGLPEAGQEFIVVKTEKEARKIAEDRSIQKKSDLYQKKKVTLDSLLKSSPDKKVLNILLRADVQGSLEAMKQALQKIISKKVELNIVSSEVGEISESDVQLAAISKAVILGFHTGIESHAEPIIKQLGVDIRLHDIIYHAVDDVKELMKDMLEKIAIEEERGAAEVRNVFKSSQYGLIAGCYVTDGTVARNHLARVRRGKEIIWKGSIASLKRVKEDVREVQKGLECGILLQGFNEIEQGDIIETYEITYLVQEL